MELLFIGSIIFIASVAIIELSKAAWNNLHSVQRVKLRKRLQAYAALQKADGNLDIVRKRLMSKIPMVQHILQHTPGMRRLDRLVLQANAGSSLDFYLLCALTAAVLAFAAAQLFLHHTCLALIIALAASLLPALHLVQKN
jgi:tight adherence protein B